MFYNRGIPRRKTAEQVESEERLAEMEDRGFLEALQFLANNKAENNTDSLGERTKDAAESEE
jgi:hypothetical protein